MTLGRFKFQEWRRTEYPLTYYRKLKRERIKFPEWFGISIYLCRRLENTKSCQTRNELNAPRLEDRQKLFIPGRNEREKTQGIKNEYRKGENKVRETKKERRRRVRPRKIMEGWGENSDGQTIDPKLVQCVCCW